MDEQILDTTGLDTTGSLYEKFLGEDAIDQIVCAAWDAEDDELLDLIGVACFQAYNRGLRGESLI